MSRSNCCWTKGVPWWCVLARTAACECTILQRGSCCARHTATVPRLPLRCCWKPAGECPLSCQACLTANYQALYLIASLSSIQPFCITLSLPSLFSSLVCGLLLDATSNIVMVAPQSICNSTFVYAACRLLSLSADGNMYVWSFHDTVAAKLRRACAIAHAKYGSSALVPGDGAAAAQETGTCVQLTFLNYLLEFTAARHTFFTFAAPIVPFLYKDICAIARVHFCLLFC